MAASNVISINPEEEMLARKFDRIGGKLRVMTEEQLDALLTRCAGEFSRDEVICLRFAHAAMKIDTDKGCEASDALHSLWHGVSPVLFEGGHTARSSEFLLLADAAIEAAWLQGMTEPEELAA